MNFKSKSLSFEASMDRYYEEQQARLEFEADEDERRQQEEEFEEVQCS